jgi:CheY-like chemotaxis protein
MPSELRVFSAQLKGEADQALALARTALEYARHAPYEPKLVAVGPVVRGVVGIMAHATMNMEPHVHVPDSLPQVETDLALFRQAMLALMVSAVEAQGAQWGRGAQPVSGRLRISGSARDDALGCRVRLAIEDGGAVVPEAERTTLFSGSGGARAGRDLAVARAIIIAAGGRITYEPVRDGNRIVVELPVAGTVLPPLPEPDPLAEAEPEDRRPLVLICDDEPLIRGLLVRFLERSGLDAVEARDGREAIEVLASRPVSTVIADQQMPDLSGSELFDIVAARHPHLASRFILTSGDPGRADVAAFTARTGVPVLPKPFDNSRLAELIRDAVAE